MNSPTRRRIAIAGGAAVLIGLLLTILAGIEPKPPELTPGRDGFRSPAAHESGLAGSTDAEATESRETEEEESPGAEKESSDPHVAAVDLLDRIASFVEAGTSDSREARRVAVALFMLARKSPDAVPPMMERLRSKACTSLEASTLIGILGGAGTEACQLAVIELLEVGAYPLSHRKKAAVAIVQTDEPIHDIDRALRRLGEDVPEVAWTSRLALAAVGNKIRERDPERFREVRDDALEDLSRAATPHDRERALWAIGNLGPREIPALVTEALEDDDETVRAAAVDALRRVGGRRADRLLGEVAFLDSAASVRLTALRTLVDRQLGDPDRVETTRGLLAHAERVDPSPIVRKWAKERIAEL